MTLILTVIISSLIVALLAVKYFEYIAIIGAAIGGAYSLVRGVSIFAGGFPNEIYLY